MQLIVTDMQNLITGRNWNEMPSPIHTGNENAPRVSLSTRALAQPPNNTAGAHNFRRLTKFLGQHKCVDSTASARTQVFGDGALHLCVRKQTALLVTFTRLLRSVGTVQSLHISAVCLKSPDRQYAALQVCYRSCKEALVSCQLAHMFPREQVRTVDGLKEVEIELLVAGSTALDARNLQQASRQRSFAHALANFEAHAALACSHTAGVGPRACRSW